MFPEIFNGSGKSTHESDVYSFGMTALELFTGKVPFSGLPDPAIPLEVSVNAYRPPRPGLEALARGLTDTIWSLMEHCWRQKPYLRPKTIPADSDLLDFIISSDTKHGAYPARFFSSKSDKMTTSYPNQIDGSQRIERISKERKKNGWFDNVWNVRLIERQKYIDCRILAHFRYGTCRVISVPKRRLEGRDITVQAAKQLSDLLRRGDSRLSMHHPNVAQLILVCDILPSMKIGLIFDVGPQAELLLDYLRRSAMDDRIRIMEDVGRGLRHLHQRGMLHGDLRSANIVVDNDIVRLVDYGLPPCVRDSTDTMECKVFKAPELLVLPSDETEMPTFESDIYALAMTFYEILTEQLPFDDSLLAESELLDDIAVKGLRPPHPGIIAKQRGLSEVLWALMSICWSADPTARPSVHHIVEHVAQLQNTARKYSWRYMCK